jgi:diguanylate cyclase (GGDEF)-like protein/PAS domain S-box-containing protein
MSVDIASEYEALLQFLYMAPVGLVQTRSDGEIVLINPLSAQLLMPLSRDGSLSNLFQALETVAPELRNMAASFAAPSGTICDAFRIQLSAGIPGKEDPKMLSVSLIKLDQQRLMAVISDVTLLARRERQLKQSEAWFNAILTGVTDYALMSLDAEGKVEAWNASIERMTQLGAPAVVGQSFALFYPPDTINAERAADYLRDADANGWSLVEGWCQRADGSQFRGSSLIAPLEKLQEDSSEPVDQSAREFNYALIIRDITDKHQSTASLLRAIMSDYLTGVSNRRAFFEAGELEIKRWQRSPRPLSLLAIDADHFKTINDTYGHAAGDAVLKNLAATLTETVRKMDTVARIGGEEFVVLLPSTDLKEAATLAERIRSNVAAQSVEFEGAAIQYTVSIGVSAMCGSMTSLDGILKSSDTALYDAKKLGRNRIEVAAL